MFLLAATGLLLTATTAASEPLVLNDGAPLPGFEKFLLTDAAEQHGAVCLDGSPGGGYTSAHRCQHYAPFAPKLLTKTTTQICPKIKTRPPTFFSLVGDSGILG